MDNLLYNLFGDVWGNDLVVVVVVTTRCEGQQKTEETHSKINFGTCFFQRLVRAIIS